MATKGRLEFSGLANYLEELALAEKDVDAAAQRALSAGAEPVLEKMLELVPVGKVSEGDRHPGNLKAHVKVEGPHQDGNFSYVGIGVIDADKETAIYGNVQEYGSSSNAAQPYIRPSFKGKKAAAMKAMKESLKGEGLV